MEMKPLWRVYDDREMEYLKSCGFRYELQVLDLRTKERMFIYMNSEELQETIDECKKNLR